MDRLVMLIAYLNLFVYNVVESKAPKVGIVGAGIAGSSTAYFLHELFGENNFSIDVFEYKKIGGRLATEKLKGNDYEVGGAVIHPRNKYMSDFVELFGLRRRNQSEVAAFGLYNGEEFVFSENSENWQMWNALKLLWRYGYDIFKLKYFIDDMLDHFSRIYTLQNEGIFFETVEEMLMAMNAKFVKYLQVSSKVGFEESGLSDLVINELVLATLLVNYGQTTDVHKFVGAVSIAGGTPGLWAVEGGNYKVTEKLLNASDASIIKGQVLNVTLLSNNKFQICYISHLERHLCKPYDIVIIAAPLADNLEPRIQFLNFPRSLSFPGQYHETVCTILKGEINNKFFGFDKNQLQGIFSINQSLFFNSIGRIFPVNSEEKCNNCSVWKIFSQVPLEKEILQKIFFNIEEVKIIPWLAYPHYDTSHSPRNFMLYKNLYHVNAIEWAASAMEMSIIGAKNVALFAYYHWLHYNRSTFLKQVGKDEL